MRTRASTSARIASVLAAGAVLAACGDGATGPDDPGLSADQARQIAETVTQEVAVFGFTGAGPAGPSQLEASGASAETTPTFDFEIQCTGGGTVAFSGEMVTDPESGTSTLEAELVYDECTRTPSDETITLTTRPAFDLTSDVLVISDTEVSEMQMDSSLSGPFDWEIGEDSGSCDLDIDSTTTVSVSSDGTTATISANTVGRICGREIDRSFEKTVPLS